MKIAIAGLGYVGMSNAVLLAQHHEVVAVDPNANRVAQVNRRESPIVDADISRYLKEKNLRLSASTDPQTAYRDAELVIIATPTD